MQDTIIPLIPSVVLAVVISIAGAIYDRIARKLCDMENHRDQEAYEFSLTQMNYKFMFWNVYFSYFILAFWERNVAKLAKSVFTFMVYKQLG